MIINNNNFFVRFCKMNRAQRIIFLSELNRHLFFYFICKTNTGPRRGIFATMMSRVNLAKTSCTRDSIFNIVVTNYKDQVLMKLCLEIVLAFEWMFISIYRKICLRFFFIWFFLLMTMVFMSLFLKKNYYASSDKLSFCSFFVKIGFQFNFFVRLI